jgi:hypothetical protein
MRLDEESFIYSRITYNLFEKMQNNSYVYGFRNCAFELGKAETLWTEYAPNRSITPQRTFVKTWLCGVSSTSIQLCGVAVCQPFIA